ncbi:MAG: formyltransferase family protein [Chloroflexota bacterium]
MDKKKIAILFLGKQDDQYVQAALDFCCQNFTDVTAHLGKWGDKLPEDLKSWQGDYVISYLSRWVVPEYLLNHTRIASFNFHPAPPEYPGIGCNNFALYEDAKEYGVTCHHMAPRVDTGGIIAVKRFPMFPTDNVASLLARTYAYQIVLFYEILSLIAEGKPLPSSEEKWTRKPFTRVEFNRLFEITPDMPKEEIARRVRAISYGPWQPKIELEGFVFELKSD